jgi:phage terminase small subunit
MPAANPLHRKGQLTPKERRFVEEYLVDRNQKAAAIRAGYSPKWAERQGHELMQRPRVRSAVEQEERDLQHRTKVTQEYVVQGFVEIFEASTKPENWDGANANRALENLGKHLGMFVKRVKVDGSLGLYDLSKASEEQLARIAAGEDPANVL